MIPSGTYRYLHHSLYVKDGPALTIFGWQGMIRAQQLDIDCSTQAQVVVSPVSNIQSIKTVLHENKNTFFVGGSIKLLPDYCIRKAKGRLLLAGARDICISIYLSIKKRMLFTFSLSFFFLNRHTPYLLASSSRFFIVAVKWPVEELHFFWHPEVRLSFWCAKGNYVVRDVWFVEILHTLNMWYKTRTWIKKVSFVVARHSLCLFYTDF